MRLRRENHRLRHERDILAKAGRLVRAGERGEPNGCGFMWEYRDVVVSRVLTISGGFHSLAFGNNSSRKAVMRCAGQAAKAMRKIRCRICSKTT